MKLFAVVFALLLSVVAFAASTSNQGASRIWITDVTIISPENLDRIVEGSVLINRSAPGYTLHSSVASWS